MDSDLIGLDGDEEVPSFVPPDIAAEIVLTRIASDMKTAVDVGELVTDCRQTTIDSFDAEKAQKVNVAFENIVSDADTPAPKMPIDVGRLETERAQAVDDGLRQMEGVVSEVFANIRQQMVSLMFANGAERENVVRRISCSQERLNAIAEAIGRGAVPNPEIKVATTYRAVPHLLKSGKLEACGASVMPELIQLLEDHAQTYRRLIMDSVEWVRNNRKEITHSTSAWSSYSFDPTRYVPFGAQRVEAETKNDLFVTYRSRELPGMMGAFITTEDQTTYGTNAMNALGHYFIDIRQHDPKSAYWDRSVLEDQPDLPVLSLEQINARISETKEALKQLQMWCTRTHLDLWQESRFEYEFMMALCHGNHNPTSEKMLSVLSVSLLKQMTRARLCVFDYAIAVVDGMIDYIRGQMDR